MKSEKDKMLNGELYHAADPELRKDRVNARLGSARMKGYRVQNTEYPYESVTMSGLVGELL